MLLAAVGCALGVLISLWTSAVLAARLPDVEFRGLNASIDLRVVWFSAALAAASVCIFGLLPALAATRRTLLPSLRQTASTGGRSRLQGLFVVAQLAMSLVLLMAGALSLRAIHTASRMDLGFVADGVLTASYDLALQHYTAERRRDFRRALREQLGAITTWRAIA